MVMENAWSQQNGPDMACNFSKKTAAKKSTGRATARNQVAY